MRSEFDLKKWISKIERLDIHYSVFREPDLNNQITAIATVSDGKLFKNLSLL
ncbi:MAG: hypothetical protein ACOCV1_00720 [Bacillota bacterium]